MTETFVAPDTDNLDDFSALMFGSAKPASEAPEAAPDESVQDNVPEDAPDEIDNGVEAEVEDEIVDETPEPESEPEAKPKKKTAQDRINELIAKQREAERLAESEKTARAALEARLAELESRPAPQASKAEPEGKPIATALNEDGSMKYPLGEFDPTFISDITRWTIDSVTREKEAESARTAMARATQEANVQLEQQWQGKLVEAEKAIPDLRTKGNELVGTFANLDPQYGQFLAQTIMQMETGPEVLYHLATHLDVAQDIVSKGPVGAALALGRLEARFAKSEQPKPRVSSAPKPAPTTRGVAIGGSVPGDTDDLDAFSSAFFVKKGR